MAGNVRNVSLADHERITSSIREAETRTSGEIFAVIAGQSDDYFFVAGFFAGLWSLVFGFLLAIAAPWFELSPGVLTLAGAQGASFATALILLGLFPRLRMLLVPRSVAYRRASSNAVRQFLAHGVHATADRAGVLIFVSLAERYAEVVADANIDRKVPQEAWDEMVATLTRHAAAGDPGEGFVLAVKQAGALLAEHFPPVEGQENELDDRLIEL